MIARGYSWVVAGFGLVLAAGCGGNAVGTPPADGGRGGSGGSTAGPDGGGIGGPGAAVKDGAVDQLEVAQDPRVAGSGGIGGVGGIAGAGAAGGAAGRGSAASVTATVVVENITYGSGTQ